MCLFRLGAMLAVLFAALTIASCGSPPNPEMQQAQGAIDAARAAGADEYARAEFAAAVDALKRAEAAVAQRDYRLALNHALDSRERAQNSAKLAADGKAVARVAADRALSALDAALMAAQSRLKAAGTARVPAQLLAEPRKTIADGEQRVQEARSAMERGDYAGVVATASAATASLAKAERQLEAAARRRR